MRVSSCSLLTLAILSECSVCLTYSVRDQSMTVSLPSEAAVLRELKDIFPHHSQSLLRNAATQHNFDLELTVANLLSDSSSEPKPLQVCMAHIIRPNTAGMHAWSHCGAGNLMQEARLSVHYLPDRCRSCSSQRNGYVRASQKCGLVGGALCQIATLPQPCRSTQRSVRSHGQTTAASSLASVAALRVQGLLQISSKAEKRLIGGLPRRRPAT